MVFVEGLSPLGFFILSIAAAMACGVCGSFLQGGMFGLTGDLPPVYTQALMGGQGLAGVAVSVNAMIAALTTKKSSSSDPTYQELKIPTMVYFLVAVFILLFCILGYLVLERLPFVHHYQNQAKQRYDFHNTPKPNKSPVYSTSSHLSTSEDLTIQTSVTDPLLPQEHPTLNWAESKVVLSKVAYHAAAVFMIFLVTLCPFPAVSQQITPVTNSSVNRFFDPTVYQTFSFMNFNTCDFIGRLLAGLVPITTGTGFQLLILSILRWGFVACFIVNKHQDGTFHPVRPAEDGVILTDIWPILTMIGFALTNGLICSLAMMRAPRRVQAHEMSTTGTMMSFFMMGGLLGGSLLSFAAKDL